jgi:UDP-N-acetylglucosamine--N-acetylmuramyl-(pentapeptide) pyrophosphoryl-undecaprenol N-acetylglucosamine transferase
LSHFALPSVLIPYPYAAEDHQTLNARIFEGAGAAILLPEGSTANDAFGDQLLKLIDHPAQLREMSERAASLAPSQAAERVAETILKYCAPQVQNIA